MACSSVSSSFGRRRPRVWASLSAFAVVLVAVYCPALLKAQQADESNPQAHIARNKALIADAAQRKLTQVQVGGLWSQIASDYQDLGQFA